MKLEGKVAFITGASGGRGPVAAKGREAGSASLAFSAPA